MKTFAHQLRHERRLRAWSQELVAEKIGTTAHNVSRWECGNTLPSIYYRQKLCELFGKTAEELGLFETDKERTEQPLDSLGAPQHLSLSPPEAATLFWNPPRPRNALFTGREAILEELHRTLSHDLTGVRPSIQAITGLGGMGKTQTALEYAYRFAEAYQSTIWLQAEKRETLYADLVTLAEVLQLGVPEEQPLKIYVETFKKWLQSHSGWLVIVDNLGNLALLREILPVFYNGHILVTTQIQAPGPDIERLDLAKMVPEEGALLLLRRAKRLTPATPLEQAPHADRQLALTLAEQLDGLPLALDQAGAYIEESNCSLAHYVALFQRHQAVLLGLRDLSGGAQADHPRSVRTTLALSLEQLHRENPATLELLRFFAFLHPDSIPETLLQDGASELGPRLMDLACDPLLLDQTVADLRRYSLLQRQPEAHTCSLHRLVQLVVQDTLEDVVQREWAQRVVRLVQRAFPPQVEYATWEQCQRLLPHALCCADLIAQWDCTFPEAAHLLTQTGDYLRQRGAYTQAQPLLERALALREQVLGPAHLEVAESLEYLGDTSYGQGKYSQAQPLYERALAIREQALGPVHPEVAKSLHNLAESYSVQEQYSQAQPLFERALAILERVSGPTPPFVADALGSLAVLYRRQGQYAQAQPLFERALAIRSREWGSNHPTVAISLNNLALLYHDQGQYAQAQPLLERALTIYEQSLEPAHPDMAVILSNLAELYRRQGQYTQAEPLLERALAIYEQAFRPTHPGVSIVLSNLADLYRELGQYEQSQPLFERALAILEGALGPNHPAVASCLEKFAVLLRAMQQPAQAEVLERRTQAIRTQGAMAPV